MSTCMNVLFNERDGVLHNVIRVKSYTLFFFYSYSGVADYKKPLKLLF